MRESGDRTSFVLNFHDLTRFLRISENSSFELRYVSSLAEIEEHMRRQESNSIDFVEIGGHGNTSGLSLNAEPGLSLDRLSVFDKTLWQDRLCDHTFISLDSCSVGLERHRSEMCFARYLSHSLKGHPVIASIRPFSALDWRMDLKDPYIQRVASERNLISSKSSQRFCDLAYYYPEDESTQENDVHLFKRFMHSDEVKAEIFNFIIEKKLTIIKDKIVEHNNYYKDLILLSSKTPLEKF